MIIKTKTFGIDKIQFKTYLNIIVSNVFLALKFISFKNMYLAKVIQVFVNWSMDALYINDIDQDIVKIIISNT